MVEMSISLFWSAIIISVALGDPVCPVSNVKGPLKSGSLLGLLPEGLVLASPSGQSPYALLLVEYATATVTPLLPFPEVTQAITSSLYTALAFTTKDTRLFVVPDVGLADTLSASVVVINAPSLDLFLNATTTWFSLTSNQQWIVFSLSDTSVWASSLVDDNSAFSLLPPSFLRLISSASPACSTSPSNDAVVCLTASATSLLVMKISPSSNTNPPLMIGSAFTIGSNFVISPDGKSVAFVSAQQQNATLYVASLMSTSNNYITVASSVRSSTFLVWTLDSTTLLFSDAFTSHLRAARFSSSNSSSSSSFTVATIASVPVVLSPVTVSSTQWIVYASTTSVWSLDLSTWPSWVSQRLSPTSLSDAVTWVDVAPVVSSTTNMSDVTVAFMSAPSTLWSAPLSGLSAAELTSNTAADPQMAGSGDAVVFVDKVSGELLMDVFGASDIQTVSGAGEKIVSYALQPNGVSAIYMTASKGVSVGCLIAPTMVGINETFSGMEVDGHLIFSGGNSSTLAATVQVGGSIVFNGCVVEVLNCPLSQTVSLVNATFLVGTPSSYTTDCGNCQEGTDVEPTISGYQNVTVFVSQNPALCPSSFSWVVFGIVAGCAGFCALVAILGLIYCNRRASRKARERLRKREMKYRRIAETKMTNAPVIDVETI